MFGAGDYFTMAFAAAVTCIILITGFAFFPSEMRTATKVFVFLTKNDPLCIYMRTYV